MCHIVVKARTYSLTRKNNRPTLMQITKLHEWNISPAQAKAVQKNLRAWVVLEDQFPQIHTIARVKAAGIKGETLMKAVVSLIAYPDMKVIEKHSATLEPEFGGFPGLNSFRTSQVIIEALLKLDKTPGLIICDGRGVIDEESFGLASHIGLLTRIPTIGVRKPPKELSHINALENHRGAWMPLLSENGAMVIGSIVRVGEDVPPIEASPGHGISASSAVKFVLDCFPREINNKPKESIAVDINQAKKQAQS